MGQDRNFGWIVPVAALLFLVFVAGTFAGVQNWLPARLLSGAKQNLAQMKLYAEAAITATPNQHLSTRHHQGNGVVEARPDEMAPGVTLVSGLFGQTLGFRLFGTDGQLLYEWPIDFFKIAPDEMNHRYHALIHGEVLYPNGDIVANLDGRGLVRFDRCGTVLWRSKDHSHHSISVDEQGHLWTPIAGPFVREDGIMMAEFRMDRIGEFDPESGAKLREIDLVAALKRSDLMGLIQENGERLDDVVHLNDVEVLSSEMAAAFPDFAAGDILVSLRNLNQLWVLDGKTETIKWVSAGSTTGQHDPDFQADGTITVFDNRPAQPIKRQDGYPGARGSRILSIDPHTGAHRTIFESSAAHPFYTPYRGKEQMLPNGNILIAETDAGRAFETTLEGRTVWSFVNGWDETRVGWVLGAERYPEIYGAFAAKSCPVKAN